MTRTKRTRKRAVGTVKKSRATKSPTWLARNVRHVLDGRATSGRAARELAPVLAEAAPLPPQDGVGGNDHERLPPPGPDSSQPDPEEAIRRAQLGSGRRSFVHSQLLP